MMTTTQTPNETQQTLSSRLATYARETAADMDGTLAEAIRAMADEPAEVALAIGCAPAAVAAWCREVAS